MVDFQGNWIQAFTSRSLDWEHRAQNMFLGLLPEQLNWRPDRGTWSIAQEFHHLVLSNRPYLEVLRKLTEQSTPESKPYKPGFWGRFLLKAVEPDGSMPAPVPKQLVPSNAPLGHQPLKEFVEIQTEFHPLALSLIGKDLTKRFSSPISRFVKLQLGDAIAINTTHNERHLLKAFRLMDQPGFPR